MKVAVSAVSEDLEQEVNPVFGRCPGYVVAEVEGKDVRETRFFPNPAVSVGMGAGIAAAQAVVSENVEAVISGNFGPNAFRVLQQSGVKVYKANGLTVKQALKQVAEGKLEQVKSFSVPGHFGMGAGAGPGFGRGQGRGRGMGQGAGRGAWK